MLMHDYGERGRRVIIIIIIIIIIVVVVSFIHKKN